MPNAHYVSKADVNSAIDFNLKFMDKSQFSEFIGSIRTLYVLNLISRDEHDCFISNFKEIKNV